MENFDYTKIPDLFKVLSHPTRLLIIVELLKGKKCVTSLGELVGAKQPNISQHLSLLRLNGIVEYRQEGKKKCYFLKDQQMLKDLFKIFRKENFEK